MFTYSEKALDHFKNPRNVGTLAEPDGVGEVGSLACGQMLRLMFKLDEQGRITLIKFQAFGCASAIAACSALTELLQGRTVQEAQGITKNDIIAYLQGLPEQREFCSDLCIEALQLAAKDHASRHASVTEEPPAVPVLDCRKLACPLNYVKTKILLDQMKPGQQLCVLLGPEGARNIPVSAQEEGHKVLDITSLGTYWRVVIVRGK